MRARVFAFLAIVCPTLGAAQTPAVASSTSLASPAALPVRRVVLYKTGVGYFEHQGRIRDRQNVTIRFTSSQLDDVLKSLTTIDAGGTIAGISYNSAAPLDQRLGALRLPLGSGATAFDLMAVLRGARVEVGARGTFVQGRLLGIERKLRTVGDKEYERQEFSIVTDAGIVRSFDLDPAVSVRVIERDMRQEVGRYLDVVGSVRDQDVRNMVIATTGAGERPLFVSYVSEVPVWKSTYRLVLPASGRPFLQGWAVVDNTIGEDWTGVELSLVAGAPQSFIQRLSQPHYRQRPVVSLPTGIQMTPQTHAGGTIDMMRGSGRAARVEGGVPGGVMGGVVGALPAAAPPPPVPMPIEQLREMTPAAQAADLGDLFEYRIREPVTLKKNQSALVPIVNAEVDVEKVSLWNRGAASGHPARAVWLSNSTGLTLDGGSLTVIDGNAFAGEGLIDPLAPTAKRLVSYAEDRGVVVTGRLETSPHRVVRVRARDGILIHETEERATWTYTASNEDASAAMLIIEHGLRRGWTLAPGQAPAETAPGAPRFRIALDGGKETRLVVREVKVGESRIQLIEVNDSFVPALIQVGFDATRLENALRPVLEKKAALAAVAALLLALETEQSAIVADQQRLRENLKALRGSAEEKLLLQRYTRQLDEQETRLDALRQQIAAVTREHGTLEKELAALIANLSFDVAG
jgi:hypothetical protein